jgi:hypothetical protein
MTRRRAATTSWRSVEGLVSIGFGRSRVVMVNEAHHGLLRSMRTRAVGRRALDAALESGVRHLAMEALTEQFASELNERRRLPDAATGYLAQPTCAG